MSTAFPGTELVTSLFPQQPILELGTALYGLGVVVERARVVVMCGLYMACTAARLARRLAGWLGQHYYRAVPNKTDPNRWGLWSGQRVAYGPNKS